jgi:hypothetical protein
LSGDINQLGLFPTEPPKPAKRIPNEVWDALAEVFGEPTTESNKKLRGRITVSLQNAGATHDEIIRRAQAWPLHFPGATLTPTALEKWWDQLAGAPLRLSSKAVAEVEKQQQYWRDMQELRRRLDS